MNKVMLLVLVAFFGQEAFGDDSFSPPIDLLERVREGEVGARGPDGRCPEGS